MTGPSRPAILKRKQGRKMKYISLTQGKLALVDDADYEYLIQWKWAAEQHGNTSYAGRYDSPGRRIFMHRQLMGLSRNDARLVDHINRNGLDNRKCNLRLCTYQQNLRNVGPHCDAVSQYKGVAWDKARNKWKAAICIDGKSIFLGRFDDETEAAKAYDIAAVEAFGSFAWLNSREGVAV